VNIVECSYELLCYFTYFCLFERLVILDDVEQLSLSQFCNEYKLCIGLERIKQQYDVFMLELFKDLNLVPHHLDILLLLSFLLDRFDGHKLTCELAACLVDLSIGALTDQGEYVVVVLFVL